MISKFLADGHLYGGVFNNIKISRSSKMTGYVECLNYLASGSSKLEGTLKYNSIYISISSKVNSGI